MKVLDEHLIEEGEGEKSKKPSSMINRLLWSFMNIASKQGFRIFFTIALARLLSPVEFGLIGMIMLVVGFADTILNFGLGPALIQNKNANQTDYSSIFWINIGIGVSLTIVVSSSAPLIAQFFNEKILLQLTLLLSLKYLITSLGVINKTLLLKRQEIKKLTIIEFLSVLISGITAVVLAWQGYGVWSLAWQVLVKAFIFVGLSWFATKWKPSLIYSKDSVKSIMSFSLNLFGNQTMNYWTNNIDKLLIGKIVGDYYLGIYKNAYTLVFGLLSGLNGTLFNVLFPSYSLISDNLDKIKHSFLNAISSMFYIISPMMVLLLIFAKPLVLISFGEEWIEMVYLFQCFATVGVFLSLTAINGNVFLALGRSDTVFKANVLGKIFVVIGIVIGVYADGISGVAFSFLFTYPLSFLINNYYLLGLLKLKISDYLVTISKELKVLIPFVLFNYLTSFWMEEELWTLLLKIPFGIIVYTALSWIFKPFLFDKMVLNNPKLKSILKKN